MALRVAAGQEEGDGEGVGGWGEGEGLLLPGTSVALTESVWLAVEEWDTVALTESVRLAVTERESVALTEVQALGVRELLPVALAVLLVLPRGGEGDTLALAVAQRVEEEVGEGVALRVPAMGLAEERRDFVA